MTQNAPKKKVLSIKNFYIPPKTSEIVDPKKSEEAKNNDTEIAPPEKHKVQEDGKKEVAVFEPNLRSRGMASPKRRGRPPAKESLDFMKDWLSIRDRHSGQLQIIEAFFDPKTTDIFNRTGRKGAKTTTAIDIAWRYAMENKNSIIHITCPTISQAKGIYWEERRLQNCDIKENFMNERYVSEYSKTDASITFINGSLIKLCGTWNVVKGRGEQPDLDIYDEVQDCDATYISATDANMLAKPHSKRIFQGTPPKKKNHYHEWEERTRIKESGVNFHFSSYINTALPHLKEELDNKKLELIAAGKEDEWIREYLAEDCFASEDRILPDLDISDYAETLSMLRSLQTDRLRPFVIIVVTDIFMSYSIGAYITSKERGVQCWVLESHMEKGIWNKSYNDIFESISENTKKYSGYFMRKFDYVVSDQTKTMIKVLSGTREPIVREKGIKWQLSGTNLLREMVKSSMVAYTDLAADNAPEFQNYLKGDDIFDYPHVCTSTLIANEFYRSPSMSKKEKFIWDQMKPLRDAGIICAPPKRKTILRKNW
jgi:hypothetical protein